MQDDPFDIETDTVISAPATLEQALINRIIEAALLASAQPMAALQLSALFPDERPVPDQSIARALEELAAACAERGVELVEVASGYRYQVKAEVHGWVSRMWTERKTRYTRATLETLALIAYRQPITRGEIEQVRGVTVSSNIIQALEEREWIRVVGHRDVPGRPALFGTTRGFLDYFGLKRLDELPPLSELKEIGELDPQLPFAGAPLAAKAAAEVQPADDSDIQGQAPASDADNSDATDLTHDAAEDDAEDLHDQTGSGDSCITPADAEVPETSGDDAPADIADHAAPDASSDDTAPHDSTTSQRPQEDDAEPVSSEQKP